MSLLLISLAAPAALGQQINGAALLIGNAAYPDAESSLKEPVNDAHALGDELRRRGFDVEIGANLSKEGMRSALDRFYGKIKSGATALIFFGGFGIQSDRQNYLIPLNVRIWNEIDVRREGYGLEKIIDELNSRGARVKIVILDASRRNPYERRFRDAPAGLAAVTSPAGTLVITSASPGAVLNESDPPVFMAELLKELKKPDATIEQVFNHARVNVLRSTKGEQVPWLSSSLDEEFVLGSASPSAARTQPTTVASLPKTEPAKGGVAGAPTGSAPSGPGEVSKATDVPAQELHAINAGTLRRDLVTDCDRLAAHPLDDQRPPEVAGVFETDIDIVAAFGACNDAKRQYQDVARFAFQAGRVAHAQKDYSAARNLFELAIKMGSATAIDDLGIIYMKGQGVAQDYTKARELFGEADAKGDRLAATLIGFLYQNGWGVPQDYGLARQQFEKGVAAGDPVAMNGLGNLYAQGLGVTKDYATSRQWYEKAAAAGVPAAMTSLGYLYANGWGVTQDYAAAREWYKKAAVKGDATAMNDLGVLYDKGLGTTQDYTEARRWYVKGATAGSPLAMNNIGWLYQNGLGGPKEYGQAREWYEKAAALGNPVAMTNLGSLYSNGLSVEKDYVKAREWYEKAAAAGNPTAMNNLGWFQQNGLGVPKDYAQARQWYEKAAAAGNATAMNNLGLFYQNGLGVPRDYAQAREWYEKAAAAGSDDAKKNLQQMGATDQARASPQTHNRPFQPFPFFRRF